MEKIQNHVGDDEDDRISGWDSHPSVPHPDMGGLGGFCVGGLVLDRVPVLTAWLFPCC